MASLALYTVGVLHAPFADPEIASLGDWLAPVAAAAAAGPGYIAHALDEIGSDGRSWGPPTAPASLRMTDAEMRLLLTFSLWTDLESAFAFTYNGLHGGAFRQRRQWFAEHPGPNYVCWWLADGQMPTWPAACARYERLHENGPTAAAFDFKHPFDAKGQPTTVDRPRVRQLAAHYPLPPFTAP